MARRRTAQPITQPGVRVVPVESTDAATLDRIADLLLKLITKPVKR